MPYKLLLADDSVTIQRVIELTFADEDVQVTAVGDGQQAIAHVTADPPDIVLADVGMPKRNGYEVSGFIKNDPTLAHIPVLLLTGAFEPVDEEQAQAVHCDGVLAKPFEPQLLIGKVKELLKDVTPSAPQPTPPQPESGEDEWPVVAIAQGPMTPGSETGAGVDERPAAAGEPVPAPIDEGAARVAQPSALPEEDLRLDLESLGLRDEPPPVGDASLDDYFDRLDAAFAHLTGGQSTRDGVAVARAAAEQPWSAGLKEPLEWPPVPTPGQPQAGIGHAGNEPDRPVLEFPASGPEAGAASSPGDDLEAVAQAVSLSTPDAFAALLDAEREQGADAVHGGEARPAASVTLRGAVTPAVIDQIVRLVVERLGEQSVRDEVARVVSATAERLVREEIERLKAGIR